MHHFPRQRPHGDPFSARFQVPVDGGELQVAAAGPPPDRADGVVLALHGVTASLMTFRSVARGLPPGICLLAPDLRGRGRSSGMPGPYGSAVHTADVLAVLDHVGVESAVVMGHSMGAFVAARLAGAHPERVRALILLDAGIPIAPAEDLQQSLDFAVSNAITRLAITFPSADQYIDGWRTHPAFINGWDDDLEAYARYDVVHDGHVARCVASPAAVKADTEEMVLDEETRTALERVHVPTHLLRAEYGLFDAGSAPVVPADDLEAFVADHPWLRVEDVPGVNHYTLVMGGGPGPDRVVAAIEDAVAGEAATTARGGH
jgi:lipase